MSSETASNAAILKQAYGTWRETRGSCSDCWMNVVDENVAFGSIPRGAAPLEFAKQYSSRAQLIEYFNALENDWTMVRYDMDEFIAEKDVVAVRGTMSWTNKKTGKTFETPKFAYWRFRNGKAIEYYEYFDTAAVGAAAA